MIELQRYNNVQQFKEGVISFLEQFEGENNLPLGVLMNLKQAENPRYMATVMKDDQLALVLLQIKPEQLIVSKPALLAGDDITDLANRLYADYNSIPGIIGEAKLVKALAREIANLSKRDAKVQMEQRIYVLKQIRKKTSSRGSLRLPVNREFSLIEDWVYKFGAEVGFPFSSKEEAAGKAHEIIKQNRLYIWEVDGVPVSMACAQRPTKTNITVGFVYTPPEERKKGYASDCVSALTECLLQSGYRTTSLYTDLANPTSNKIYMEIGYEPVMDSTLIHFTS